MRLLAFVLALLLLVGAVDPERGWLITLVVLTGLAAVKPRWWGRFHVWPAVDARLGAFVLAVLLLAGAIDPTRDWLIALAAVTGVAAFMPRIFHVDLFGFNDRAERRRRWDWHWDWDSDDDDPRSWRRWRRMEHRINRRMERRRPGTDPFGDDWP
jgi:hypothetical protein